MHQCGAVYLHEEACSNAAYLEKNVELIKIQGLEGVFSEKRAKVLYKTILWSATVNWRTLRNDENLHIEVVSILLHEASYSMTHCTTSTHFLNTSLEYKNY